MYVDYRLGLILINSYDNIQILIGILISHFCFCSFIIHLFFLNVIFTRVLVFSKYYKKLFYGKLMYKVFHFSYLQMSRSFFLHSIVDFLMLFLSFSKQNFYWHKNIHESIELSTIFFFCFSLFKIINSNVKKVRAKTINHHRHFMLLTLFHVCRSF